MNIAPIILGVLALTSAMLGGMMLLSWHQLGRQKHALTWAIGYGCAASQWGITALGSMLGDVRVVAIGALGVVVSCVLVMVGARQRVGLPNRLAVLLPVVVIVAVLAVLTVLSGLFALRAAMLSGIAAVALALAARAIWPRDRRPQIAESVFMTALALLALFLVASAGIAVFTDQDAVMARDNRIFLFSFIIGFPPLYIGTGVAAVLLIAGDVSAVLRRLVTHDELTGILNRRGLEEAAVRAIANAQRHGQQLAAVICDLDHFKALNDALGHIAGDDALRRFAETIVPRLRTGDVIGRIGGDEFAMLLVNSDAQNAAEVVERVREQMRESFSASFGVTEMRPADRVLDDLIVRADRALYKSKQQGRNRVTLDEAK